MKIRVAARRYPVHRSGGQKQKGSNRAPGKG